MDSYYEPLVKKSDFDVNIYEEKKNRFLRSVNRFKERFRTR